MGRSRLHVFAVHVHVGAHVSREREREKKRDYYIYIYIIIGTFLFTSKMLFFFDKPILVRPL